MSEPAYELGDWAMQMVMEEQERRATETLQSIYSELVLPKKLNRERFNELVYLTGVRAKFE